MSKKWWLIATLLLLVFVVVQVPARFVINKVVPATSSLRLQNVSGSLWQGRTDIVTDKLVLHNVQWHVTPLQLFLGRLQMQIVVDDSSVQASTTAAIGFGGKIALRNTTVAMPAEQLNRFLPMKGLQLHGAVDINLTEVTLQSQQLQQLQGDVRWQNASVKTPMGATELGAYRLDLSRDDAGAITGDVQDLAGVLDLQGKLVFVNQNLSFNGSVKRDLPAHVQRFFRMFARDNGSRLEFTFNRSLGG